jgi:hypothetical protein
MPRPINRSHPQHPLYGSGQADPTTITEESVTQHEAALSIDAAQVVSGVLDPARVATGTPVEGDIPIINASGDLEYTSPGGGTPHALDDHTDVNAPTPADGDVLTWDNGAGEWVSSAPSAAGLVQGDVNVTTASLADDAEETGTVALGKNGFILNVVADRACWVRLYGTAAERTADAARLITEDPDVPVLADLIFEAGALTIPCAPLIGYANRDGTVVTSIYYSIINTSGATSTVSVDFTRLTLET